MNVTDWFSAVSLIIALTALAVSSYLTKRQAQYARSQIVINFAAFFTEARDSAFIDDVRFISKELPIGLQGEVWAVSNMPSEIRQKVYRVTNYFDQLGLLVASRTLDADIVIGLLGNWLDQCWRVLEPSIFLERELRAKALQRGDSVGSGYLEFYEDLVVRTRLTPPVVAQRKMRLRELGELSSRKRRSP